MPPDGYATGNGEHLHNVLAIGLLEATWAHLKTRITFRVYTHGKAILG